MIVSSSVGRYFAVVVAAVVAAVVGCTLESDSATPSITSIAALRNLETNNQTALIKSDISIEGQVTANDRYGEFYNQIIIQDDSDAVKLLIEMDDNYLEYPIGSTIQIYCSGLYLRNYDGEVALGAQPSGDYTLDYIAQSQVGQYLKFVDTTPGLPAARLVSINQLSPLISLHLVELQGVRILNDSITTFCQRDTSTGRTVDTSHIVVDSNNDSLELFVDRLCTYCDNELPSEQVTLNAILGYFDSEYSITITSASIVAQ